MVVSYDLWIIHQRVSLGDIADMEDYHDEGIKNPMYQIYARVLQ